MSHNLFRDRMAFVGETPWHGLGRQVAHNVSAQVMLKEAGLDWHVQKIPAIGARIVSRPGQRSVHDRYFLQRDALDDEKIGPVLGVVSDGYEVLQNDEAFEFFEPLLRTGTCRFEAAGALGNGERVWVQVRMDDPIRVTARDEVDRFFLLSNSHDGRGALSLRFTPVRVVCQNTLNLATRGGDSVVTIRHSRHMRDRLTAAQVDTLLRLIGETFHLAAERFRRMAQTPASPELKQRYLDHLFPRTEKQRETRTEPKRWAMVDAVLEDTFITPRETRGSFWALYNAVTRTEDYRVSPQERGAEARLARVWFGASADLKVHALGTAIELCL